MTDTATAIKNEVIRGGVTIAKWSLETNERKPQGGATLAEQNSRILTGLQRQFW